MDSSTSEITNDEADDRMITVSQTITSAEMGKFHIYLIVTCLVAYFGTSMLPAILNKSMNVIIIQQELLWQDLITINQVIYTCTIIGTFSWAVMADVLSRKWTFIFVVLINAISTIGVGRCSCFICFGLFRALSSFSSSGIMVVAVTHLTEFQSRFRRGSVVCALQISWLVASMAVPVEFPVKWNVQTVFASFPLIISLFSLLYLPESPKFWMGHGRTEDALASLRRIFFISTRKNIANLTLSNLEGTDALEEIQKHPYFANRKVRSDWVTYRWYILLVVSQFAVMFSYQTKAMWFNKYPARGDSFFPTTQFDKNFRDGCTSCCTKRFENKTLGSNDTIQEVPLNSTSVSSVATKSELLTTRFTYASIKKVKYPTTREKLYGSFVSSLMILLLVHQVDSFPRNLLLSLSLCSLGMAMFFMRWFANTPQIRLIFTCIVEMFTLTSISVAQCVSVDVFSPTIRTIGVATVVGAGYMGTIVANMGLLVAAPCVLTFIIMAFGLLITGLLFLITPDVYGVLLK